MPKTIASLSIDAKVIYDRLKTAIVGELIPYKELNDLVDRNLQKDRGPLTTARRIAQRNDQVVFDCVLNSGLRRLSDVEVVGTGAQTVRRIRSAAKNGARKITSVKDYAGLPNESKIEHNMYASVFGAVYAAMAPKRLEKVSQRVIANDSSQLPLAKTLEAFKGN